MSDPDLAATVHHSGGSYPVVAGWGIIEQLGERLQSLGVKSPAYIITDENVMRHYGRAAQWSLQRSGIAAHCFIINAGEPSKSFELAQAIYQWLVGLKAERGQAIIAVGGGVVGDLAGFVASTFLRGVPFVQVPTSMAAMVDASIEGGGEPAPGQEPGGRFLPASGRAGRCASPFHPGQAGAIRGLVRGHQAWADPGPQPGGRL